MERPPHVRFFDEIGIADVPPQSRPDAGPGR